MESIFSKGKGWQALLRWTGESILGKSSVVLKEKV
jgi:hypothetical protein